MLSRFNFLKNKKLCLALVAGILVGLVAPSQFVKAQVVTGIITGLVGGVVGAIAGAGFYLTIVSLIFTICGWVLNFGDRILNWALSGPFKMAMTNPNNNIIIQLGWTLTRDFTNMLFILGLAYIGLATALDIVNFDTKKAFINLIIIALLINFTPVICGVIVDVSNLVTNFFIQDVQFDIMTDLANDAIGKSIIDEVGSVVFNGAFGNKEAAAKAALEIFTTAAFLLFGGGTLLLLGGLFVLRPIIIWILVILSPLAFFAWIFEKTRKYFDMWWKNFIGWAFISVPASFFLYLAYAMTIEIKNSRLVNVAAQGNNDAFAVLAPGFIITAFMAFGFYATKTLTPIGASAVMGAVSKIKGKTFGIAKKYGAKTRKLGSDVGAGVGAGAVTGVAQGKGWGRLTGGAIEGLRGGATPEGRIAGRRAKGQFLETIYAKRKGSTERQIAKDMGYGAIREDYKNLSIPELEKISNQKFSATKEASATRAIAVEQLISRGEYGKTGAEAEKDIAFLQKAHPGVNISDLNKQAPELQQYSKAKDFEKDIVAKAPGATKGTALWDDTAKEVNEEWVQRHYNDISTMAPAQKNEAVRKIRKESLNHLLLSLRNAEIDSMADSMSANQRKHIRTLVTPGSASLADLYTQEASLRAAGQIARADRLSDAILEAQTNAKFTV